MQTFAATLNDPALSFQYSITSSRPTVKDGLQSALKELKRQRPGQETEDIKLLGVRSERPRSIKFKGDDEQLQKDDILELQRDTALLTDHDTRRKANARLTYEPAMVNVAYVFMARMISGKQTDGATEKRPANRFLSDDPKNRDLVQRVLQACKKEDYDPEQSVEGADNNYALRQGFVHNNSDAWLKRTAEDLRTVGALDLFRESHPFQCMIVEHMDEILAVL